MGCFQNHEVFPTMNHSLPSADHINKKGYETFLFNIKILHKITFLFISFLTYNTVIGIYSFLPQYILMVNFLEKVLKLVFLKHPKMNYP